MFRNILQNHLIVVDEKDVLLNFFITLSGKDMGRNLCVPCLVPRVRKTCLFMMSNLFHNFPWMILEEFLIVT